MVSGPGSPAPPQPTRRCTSPPETTGRPACSLWTRRTGAAVGPPTRSGRATSRRSSATKPSSSPSRTAGSGSSPATTARNAGAAASATARRLPRRSRTGQSTSWTSSSTGCSRSTPAPATACGGVGWGRRSTSGRPWGQTGVRRRVQQRRELARPLRARRRGRRGRACRACAGRSRCRSGAYRRRGVPPGRGHPNGHRERTVSGRMKSVRGRGGTEPAVAPRGN